MFDAGAIQAHLDVETATFDRKMTAAEERVRNFEHGRHEVRLSAVFDNASLGRARMLFTQLDQQLSREAMQRLRSSPQGSVLGALSAMLHPGQMTGAPTASQSAQQGAVGRTVRAIDQSAPAAGGGGTGQPRDALGRFTSAAAPLLSRVGGGGGGGGGVGFVGGGGGGRGGTGFISGRAGPFTAGLAGGIGPGILGIGGIRAGLGGLAAAGLGALPAAAAGLGALGVAGLGAGVLGAGFGAVQSQISPLSQARTQAQAAVKNATTPAQAAAAQAKLAQVNQQISQLSPALQSILASETKIQDTWEKFAKSLAPLFAGPVGQVATLFSQLIGPLHQLFSGAATLATPLIQGLGDLAKQVLPLLAAAFRAVAPLVRPLLAGLTGLITGILPGLITLLKAAAPAVNALGGGLADIGRGLGTMLSQFAPVIKASSVILSALLDVISALFPIVGQLAGVFAQALAPVFVTFAGVVKSLLPFLVTIGKVLAELAGAVLSTLVSAFTAVAQILVAISPALKAFADAFSHIFIVLENSGVFAILGDALEALVKPIARLITALLTGLTPLLPPIIKFISQLSGVLIGGLVQAISAVLPPLTQLATVVLQSVAQILPIVLPLLVSLTRIFTGVVVAAVSDLAIALSSVLNAIPAPVLHGIVIAVLAIVAAMKLWAAIQAILDIELSANPIGLIAIAVAGLVIAIVEMSKHWSSIWATVKRVAADVWRFIWDGFGKFLLPLLGPAGLIALGAIELAKHWHQVTTNITNWARDLLNFFHRVFGTDIANFFTKTIPHWWDLCYQGAVAFGRNIRSTFNSVLHWFHQVFGTDVSNFFTRTLPNTFDSAVSAIGRMWNKVKNAIRGPIKAVVNATIVPLFNGIDAVTNFVGLHKPLQGAVNFLKGMAAGGKITHGTHETADDVLIRASRNETVLSAVHSRMLAPLLAMIGVPGYASGGLVNPIGRGLRPERVDMGVDYGGFGALYALGSGQITSVNNSGWPGGTFIDLRLNPPYGSGYWYYAEDISPAVRVGQAVHAGQLLGHAYGGPSGIEVGWASGRGGQTAAARDGQARAGQAHGDPGLYPTAWGIAASNLIGSLGGPRGIVHGPVQGGTPGFGGIIRTVAQIFSGLGKFARTAIDIAKGDFGGALGSLMGIFKPSTGGAGGGLGQMLLRMPRQLAGDVIHHIVGAVKNFVSGQQSQFGGGTFGGGALGGDAATNRRLMQQMAAAYGWSSGVEWNALNTLEMHEAGYNRFARNPSSGAYGIPQAYPPTKMPFAAQAAGGSHAGPQIAWMLNYIRQTYRDPVRAWAQYFRHPGGQGSYDKGGVLREPVIGFGQSGRTYTFAEHEPEIFTPSSQSRGPMIGSVHIQLPEGQTVARALTDLSFWVSVAAQQGGSGVMPGG